MVNIDFDKLAFVLFTLLIVSDAKVIGVVFVVVVVVVVVRLPAADPVPQRVPSTIMESMKKEGLPWQPRRDMHCLHFTIIPIVYSKFWTLLSRVRECQQ